MKLLGESTRYPPITETKTREEIVLDGALFRIHLRYENIDEDDKNQTITKRRKNEVKVDDDVAAMMEVVRSTSTLRTES